MSRYGLRVGPAYPWPKYRGDVIHFGDSSREQVEEIRDQMATGEFHEVVELDGNGQVIEPRANGGPIENPRLIVLNGCVIRGVTEP